MKCPRCNHHELTPLKHEVDIGVGTQVHIYGYECPECGDLSFCEKCGAVDVNPHEEWCGRFDYLKEGKPF